MCLFRTVLHHFGFVNVLFIFSILHFIVFLPYHALHVSLFDSLQKIHAAFNFVCFHILTFVIHTVYDLFLRSSLLQFGIVLAPSMCMYSMFLPTSF